MDDRRLDRLEQALVRRSRAQAAAAAQTEVPRDFTAQIMRDVRARAEAAADFWNIFSFAARRFAPVGALAATVACGYAQLSESIFNQALLALSMNGGSGALGLVRLLP
jgi:hypothetical protein